MLPENRNSIQDKNNRKYIISKKYKHHNQCHILYDDAAITEPTPDLFDPAWLANNGEVKQIASGRGEAWFVNYKDHNWVLRKYLRGGLVAKFNRNHYIGWSVKHSRAWKEWNLLYKLSQLGLPVPVPVATRVRWSGVRLFGFYQASILLDEIHGAETLAERLKNRKLSHDVWAAVGVCIRNFHNEQVYHADLNANNILFDKNGVIYLIDFDRGRIRKDDAWKVDNMERLLRSLKKLKSQDQVLNFNDNDWLNLMGGYKQTSID